MIEGHGDDLFRYEGKVRINFSTNIPQTVDHVGLVKHLYDCGAVFRNYPEPEPRSVGRRLADIHGVRPGNVIVTNGATEVIYLLAQSFSGSKSAVIAPTFREYQDACKVFSHEIAFIDSLNGIEGCDPDLVWLCNPNNPTGRVFEREMLLDVVDRFPGIMFVVDQAYGRYSVKPVISDKDVVNRDNLVVLHSLTKQFVVPGLRIGYAVGPEDIIGRLRAIRMPWSVNSIAIEAAHYLIDHIADYRVDYELLHDEALRLRVALDVMGIETEPTDCNFLLGRLPDCCAGLLKEWLVENYGILIRDASNFEGLTSRHFRIAAQRPEENDELIKALRKWMSL